MRNTAGRNFEKSIAGAFTSNDVITITTPVQFTDTDKGLTKDGTVNQTAKHIRCVSFYYPHFHEQLLGTGIYRRFWVSFSSIYSALSILVSCTWKPRVVIPND